MKVLGIESSCDETSVAVVEDGKVIFSNIIATQIAFHKLYGGVVPEIASRKHIEWITLVTKKAIKDACLSLKDIDGVAVTNRPGLAGSLIVGLTYGKALAYSLDRPFIAVNHILGHLYASHLNSASKELAPEYPYLGVLVSGGHTLILVVTNYDKVSVLGSTIDDSIGEAFDKVAKYYGLGYPGGVIIERLSKEGDKTAFSFPIAKIKGTNKFDVSYSGLKTAVLHQRLKFLRKGKVDDIPNLCASFQEAACKVLVEKILLALEETGLNKVVIGGGVAANSRLREMLQEGINRISRNNAITCYFPPLKLCTDNAAMIAGLGYHYLKEGRTNPLEESVKARISYKDGIIE